MFSFLKTTVQSASHNTGTEISVLSILLNPWPICVSAGSSGDNCSCLVVTESIVVVFAHPTLVSSCGSTVPRYLCAFVRKLLVAAESGWPYGFTLFSRMF